MVKKLLLTLFFIFFYTNTFSQTDKKTDSLLLIVKNTKNDSLKVAILNKVAFKYVFNNEIKAREIIQQSEKIAQNNNLKYGYNEVMNIKGIINDVSGKADSACFYFKKSLALSKQNNFKTLEVRSVNNLGMYNFNNGKNDEALKCFYEALKINESLPKEKQINEATCQNNIGLIYQSMNLFKKALPFHEKALAIRIAKNMTNDQSTSYNNLGICYKNIGATEKALENYKKGLIIAKQTNNQIEYYKLIDNLASIYIDKKQHRQAISMLLEANNKPKEISITPKSLLDCYGKLCACYVSTGQPKEAIKYAVKGLEIVKSNPDLEVLAIDIYRFYGAANYSIGNDFLGDKYLVKYFELNQKIFSNKSAENIANLEVKYETEKKEKQLAQNKLEIFKNEQQAKRKNLILVAVSFVALFIALLGYLLYRQQKLKNNQQAQEFELKTAIEKIETQNQLQEQRLSISRDLHDNIGSQLTFIISSVDNVKYGFEIDNPKLDNKLTNISSFAKDTIIELRDTIWAMNNNAITFEDLQTRISNFIEKASTATSEIVFSFETNKDLKTKKFTSIEGINVYRTIQEAVNNAMKYAQPKNININVNKQQNDIKITIEDNGKGFDLANANEGNGLKNMKKRIEEIGGTLVLNSSNAGTVVEILI